jgi:hypothetical protein
MGAFVIVLLSPVIDDTLDCLDRTTSPAMQAAIPKDAVKALVMAVLP